MADTRTSDTHAPAAVSDTLLSLLRCPVTLSPLRRDGDVLVAEVGGLRYPVREGIPQMIAEEAMLPDGVASLEDLITRLRSEGHAVRP